MKHTTPEYKFGWFNQDICQRLDRFLDAVANKQSPRLMLFAPPRHGKSELVSRRFPAYALGRYPDFQFIATAYAADLANGMNLDVQRIIDSDPYRQLFPNTQVPSIGERSMWRRRSDIFDIKEHLGSYRSAGVDGGITGMGGNVLTIDDPIKDFKEASSVTVREGVWEWYRSTLYTRKAPGAGILLIMTRWNMDDLAGRLLAAQETGGDKWEVAYYPAFAEQEEPFRKIGDPLHPERYSAQELHAIESALGSHTFAALYQQHPMPREGGMFKRRWFGEPVPVAPISRQVVRSWDLAATDSGGDWTVGVKMSKADSGMFYIEHIERFRGSSLDVETAVLNYAKVHDGKRVTVRLPQDAGQAGKGQVAAFARLLAGQNLDIIRETGSKEVRASPFAAQCEAGNVKLVAGPWNNDFLAELETFPMGAHDDQVDAAAGAFTTLCESPRMVISEEALQRARVNPLVSRMRRR